MGLDPVSHTDWAKVVLRVADGDALALFELSRKITGFLVRLRAFDYQSDWDDLIQKVVLATLKAVAQRGVNDRAVLNYMKTTTKNEFIDRLRRLRRETSESSERRASPADLAWPVAERDDDRRLDVRRALEALSETHRLVVVRVYVEGMTYQQAADETGLPLGTLKRYLRQALEMLREALGASGGLE